MRRKFTFLVKFACMLLFTTQSFAQDKTITGTVLSESNGNPMDGVTVTNKRTDKKTTTNAAGYFTILAKKGDVISFSFVGFNNIDRTYNDETSLRITLVSSNKDLGDVVVTAFGIKKDARGLTYSAQKVNADEVSQTQRENFLNAIQGRVAGATVNETSGAPGASTQIVLRGFNSLSGNVQPLIIVDGLPVNNNVFNQGQLASDQPNRNSDYSNRALDINPDDIESITVLKGPEATALYGIDAGSGALIITTKKGTVGKMKMSYDNSVRFDINYRWPEVQNIYDNGTNGVTQSGTRNFFGAKYKPDTKLYDNVRSFFQTGISTKHNLNFDGGTKKFTYRANGNYTYQAGTIPNTDFRRITASLTTVNKVMKGFEFTNKFSYSHTDNNKAFRGAGGFLQNLLLWPHDDDATKYLKDDGKRRKIIEDPAFAELDNPFFDINKNSNWDRNDRYIYNTTFNLDIKPWFNITARGQIDYYAQFGQQLYHPESNAYYSVRGRLEYYSQKYRGLSGSAIATFKKDFKKVKTILRIGTAMDEQRTTTWSVRADSLVLESGFTITELMSSTSKRINSQQSGRDTLRMRRLQGVFGELNLNFNNILYLNFTGRNDWTSTLPSAARSFFYPSVSSAFIFSDVLKAKWLSFGKLRGAYAETAKDAAPYASQSIYTAQLSSGGGVAYGFTRNNTDLVPERQKTFELGTELKFFKNKLGVDATYYNTRNIGQIVSLVRLSYATAFVLNTMNIADTKNEGVEISLNYTPIQKKNFSWKTNLNFSKMWNKVTYLPANIPEYYNSDSWIGNYRNGLIPGGTTTSLTGQTYLKNNAGDILIDPTNGYPVADPNYRVIAERLPNFTFGLQNQFKWKQWSLSMLLDFRFGGDVLNGNELWMTTVGLSRRTENRETPKIIQGVLRDGLENTATPTKNSIQIVPHFQQDYYTGRSYAQDYVEKNINWIRCRDLSLSYTFSKGAMNRSKYFKDLSVFATATDLFIISNYSGLNPQGNGNTPATSGIGGFGVDLGTMPLPMGINFGIRTTFKN